MKFDMFEVPDHVSDEDVQTALKDYARSKDDWYAHAYTLWLRAQDYDDKYNATIGRKTIRGRISGIFERAAYGYERAALRAQAHQTFRTAVAQGRRIDDYGTYNRSYFSPHGELMDMIRNESFRRRNITNGHGALYAP